MIPLRSLRPGTKLTRLAPEKKRRHYVILRVLDSYGNDIRKSPGSVNRVILQAIYDRHQESYTTEQVQNEFVTGWL